MPTSEAPRSRRRSAALAGHRGAPADARTHLRDADWQVRIAALRSLRRLDRLTPRELHAAMSDTRAEVRAVAIELAASVSEPTPATGLEDPDPRVVEVACWSAGERRPTEPGTVERLTQIAGRHPDPLCRESAIAALGAIGDRSGLAAVLDGLDDKPAVRRRAVVALAAFEGPEVDEAMDRARTDRDRQVRQAAEELLGPR